MTTSMRAVRLTAALCLAAGCGAAGDDAEESRVAGEVPAPARAGSEAGEVADTGGSRVTGGAGEAGEADESAAPVCLLGGPFVADGVVEVQGESDAGSGSEVRRITDLRWHRYEGCERFVLDLGAAGGEDATRAGQVRAQVLRELGVVRVSLPEVVEVDPEATDVEVAGPLARAAYVVASPEGQWLYVDVHLGEAVEANVAGLREPGRVLVDLRPGGGPVPEPAPAADRVVVLEPRSGPATYPLTVTGYAWAFEANVVVRLEQDGRDVYEDFTTATAWTDAWGHYSFRIADGPAGEVTLHVGEYSARDGSWEGVAVPLEVR